jgi:adenylyl cyclase-associated protein
MRGGSEFYSNRILKDFKGKDQIQVDWVNAFNSFLKELQAYIKQFHTTGLTWNPRGGDASTAQVSSSSSSQSSGGPPPPPPMPTFEDLNSNTERPNPGGLFAELNKGADITKGLKKVTKDMKNKNQPKTSSVVPGESGPKSTATGGKHNQQPAKPPKFALEGAKWAVENQVNNKNIVISDTEAKQTCYIYKCVGSTIQIKGKVNAIVVDSCSKTAVVFETLVSSCDIVNCNSVEVQVTGKVPSISIDKTSGCQLYMGKASLDAEIYSSKSDQMNVLIPGKNEGDDLVEIPIPEQFRTLVKGGKLHTETSSHV